MHKIVVLNYKHFRKKNIELKNDEVHLWIFNKKDFASELLYFENDLNAFEKGLASEYKNKKDKEMFILRHGLLLKLLQRYLSKKNISYSYTPFHKPFIKGENIFFNESFSENYCTLVFSKSKHVGVDVEVVKPIFFLNDLIDEIFCYDEKSYISTGDKLLKFFQIWSRKEAILKSLGIGIVDDLKKVNSNICDKLDHWKLIKTEVNNKSVWLRSLLEYKNISVSIALT